jgi:flavin-dependent dehydrogenase
MKTGAGEAELLILGSGPAGCAAALRGAQLGLRAILLARGRPAAGAQCGRLANRRAIDACRALGVDLAGCGEAFDEVALRSWDFTREHTLRDDELAGVVVDPARLRSAMHDACREAGVSIAEAPFVGRAALGEQEVSITTGAGAVYSGRVLMVADGIASSSAALAQLVPARGAAELRCAAATWPEARRGVQVSLILGSGLRLAIAAQGSAVTHVALLTRDLAMPARQQLEGLLVAGAKRGIFAPRDAAVAEGPAIAGAALDLDTHVGKRTLLLGSAGGCAAALSGEGLYPSVAAAAIAAETAAEALKAPLIQDALSGFGAAWRGALAGYLAPPSTDLSLLMPMLFQNPQMARRTARAILLGEAF